VVPKIFFVEFGVFFSPIYNEQKKPYATRRLNAFFERHVAPRAIWGLWLVIFGGLNYGFYELSPLP